MNGAQRKYLVDKIKEQVKIRVKSLEDSKPEYPNLSNYILHEVMSGKFQIIDNDAIRELIKKKALDAKQGVGNWMGTRAAWGTDNELAFKPEDFFILPDSYKKLRDECRQKRQEIKDKVSALHVQSESLITRITLASDKVLQTMINEVDDMGNISLMETKLKLLN